MRLMAGHRVICIGFALGLSQVALADQPVRAWLDRMSHALNNLDYQGTFIYQHDNQLEAIRVVHIVNDAGEHERLYSLNGAPREVIRTPDSVRCILPDDRSVIVDRRLTQDLFPAVPPSQVGDLEDYYRFRFLGEDRVAGLDTRVLGIEPKDRFRYGYRLWLEKDTGMLLRSELVGEDGEAIEQMMFASINLGEPIPMKALDSQLGDYGVTFGPRPPPDKAPGVTLRNRETSRTDLEWSVGRVPPGFHLKSHGIDDSPRSDGAAEHLVFTDGLASVSVYVEPASKAHEAAPDGVSNMGAINAFSHEHREHRVTVVGEVPPATVRSIAMSVRQAKDLAAADD